MSGLGQIDRSAARRTVAVALPMESFLGREAIFGLADAETLRLTVEVARQRLIDKAGEGGSRCSCCGQFVKIYRRSLDATMSRMLIEFYRITASDRSAFLHVSEFSKRSRYFAHTQRGGHFAQLRRWDLIEEMPKNGEDDGARTTGFWRITAHGIDFVRKLTTAPSHCYTYNAETIGYAESRVSIGMALGKRFDYQELMEGAFND